MRTQQVHAPTAETYKMLELFGDVLTTVKRDYVVPVSDKKLIQAAIDGMLTSLDPHSGYLDPSNFSDMQDTTRGDYGGLGLVIQGEDGAVKIVSPMDGSPAARVGLRAGDYITAIDGQSILGQPPTTREGHAGRGGHHGQPDHRPRQGRPLTVKLTREVIALHTVSHHVEGDIGYLRVSGFDEKTGSETTAALKDLKAKIPHLKGVVLDLRNNPGGLVDASVDVASDFLDGGEIVSQRGRDPARHSALQRQAQRRPDPRRASGGDGELRLGLGRRDRRRRLEGSGPRHGRGPDQLREGLGADRAAFARRGPTGR